MACQLENPSQTQGTATAVRPSSNYHKLSGKTMGTTYNITYQGDLPQKVQQEIDQLLIQINQEVSTYIDTSFISQFNQSDGILVLQNTRNRFQTNTHFRTNFEAAQKIYDKTQGAFDPTVMPLVNYWGFGYTPKRKVTAVDSQKVSELLKTVGFDKVSIRFSEEENTVSVVKENPKSQLDFSALAKGYGVDAIGKLLEEKKVQNYFVEIGGETLAKGQNAKGKKWRIGINTPEETASTQAIFSVVELSNNAIATSGNYRNYHEVNGKKYGHTINPKTGFPEMNTTLSASVLAPDCMTADAYATAFMTMGYQKALELTESLPNLESYLIFANEKGEMETVMSSGMKQYLK